jgi:hypothetical protein
MNPGPRPTNAEMAQLVAMLEVCGSSRSTSPSGGARSTAARMLEAERQFRRVIGYRDLAQLAVVLERDLTHPTISTLTKEAVRLIRD